MPVHFTLKSQDILGFAGVWDVWNSPNGKLSSRAIITTEPNELTREVHNRMPVILSRKYEAGWLDPKNVSPDVLLPMLRPYPAGEMIATQVNPALNKPSFEGPACLEVPPAPA